MQKLLQRYGMLFGILGGGLAISVMFGQPLAFGESSQAERQLSFVGGPPERLDTSDVRTLRLRFAAGSRSNWHSHSGFQIIMAEEGAGRTQERGGPVVAMLPGQPVYAGPDVVHWHGAAPDEHVVQLTFISGEGTRYEPVSEQDYHAAVSR